MLAPSSDGVDFTAPLRRDERYRRDARSHVTETVASVR